MSKSKRQKQKQILEDILNSVVTPEEAAEYGVVSAQIKGPLTRFHLLMLKLVDRACHGDLSAIKEIRERLYGKDGKAGEEGTGEMNYYDFLMSIVEDEQMSKDLPDELEETEPVDTDRAAGYDLLEDLE